MRVDADQAIRAGGLQAVLILILALIMLVLIPGDFFDEWGWLTGPIAWLGSASVVTWRIALPWFPAVMGATFAAIPMMIALAFGLHWIGVIIGIAVFGAWCGTLAAGPPQQPPRSRRDEPDAAE